MDTDSGQEVDWATFGRWLAEQRVALGFKKQEVIRRADVSQKTLYKLEAGDSPGVGDEVLVRIAYALMLDPTEVLARAGRRYEPQAELPPLPSQARAIADILEADPTLETHDRRLLVELYHRLSSLGALARAGGAG
jgi:transcriptional regulator with XRE-family HTH domain